MGVFRFSTGSGSSSTPTNSENVLVSGKKSRIRSYVTFAAAGVFISAGVVAATASPAPDNKPLKNSKHNSTITLRSSNMSSSQPDPSPTEDTVNPTTPAQEQSGATARNQSSNTVTINEKTINLPANGTVYREFTDDSGQTSLNASSTSSSSNDGSSTSTLDINISTDSNNWRVSEDNP